MNAQHTPAPGDDPILMLADDYAAACGRFYRTDIIDPEYQDTVNDCDAAWRALGEAVIPLRESHTEMLEALQCAHNVLFLLSDELEGMGLGAENVLQKVADAIAKAGAA